MTPRFASKVVLFEHRWLALHGVSGEKARTVILAAQARARRYPAPMGALHWVLKWAAELLLPLLTGQGPLPVSGLSQKQFEEMDRRAHVSRIPLLRSLYLLLRLPLWDALFSEADPVRLPHPLADRLERRPPPRSAPPDEIYDLVVIGSGAGGAPVAWELARAGKKVVILEEGSLVQAETTAEALRKNYLRQAFVASLSAGLLPILAGRGLGGTTAVNMGTSLAPSPETLLAWEKKTQGALQATELGPYLARVLELLPVRTPSRELLSRAGLIFEEGLEALGRGEAYVLPRNSDSCQGIGRCAFGCPVHSKRSTDISFLPEAMDAGCLVLPGHEALSVRDEAGGASVSARAPDGSRYRLNARHVVISAGALSTPKLLRSSRLGTRWRAAGNGLRIHPAAKVFALMPEKVDGGRGIPQGLGYRPPELPRIVMEGVFTPYPAVAPVFPVAGMSFRSWMASYDHVATFGMMLIERAEGRVRWAAGWPLISYRLQAEDVLDLARGLKVAGEAYFAAGATKILLPFVGARAEYSSKEELSHFRPESLRSEDLVCSGFHPQGTASIGRVVDGNLRVIGSRNVSVCDASVLPLSPGVNPQVTIMALSLRLADHLRGAGPSVSA
ncbi:MAG: GMC family oxidoreductase [Bdellovibrionales bacterium]|nr:GMC family oxidoreductase [Bdellovibrionales bacterium]